MSSIIQGFSKQIIKLYKGGWSTRKIATYLNCGHSSVAKFVSNQGISRGNLEWQNDKERKLLVARKAGLTKKGRPLDKARIYNIDKTLFYDLSNTFDAYLLGVIVTDGHVSERTIQLQVSSIDIDWIRLLANKLNVPIKIDKRNYPYLNINSVEIVKTLRNLGINKNKTTHPQFITIPTSENDFLRGLLDGDGSIYLQDNNRPIIKFGNTNKQLVDWICSKFKKKGSKGNVLLVNDMPYNKTALRPYKIPFWVTGCSGKAAKLILEEIYYEGCFANPRKYKTACEGKKWKSK